MSNDHVHPIFAQVLDAFANPQTNAPRTLTEPQTDELATPMRATLIADNAELLRAVGQLRNAVSEMIDLVGSFDDIGLTRDLPKYKAEAIFDDVMANARTVLRQTSPLVPNREELK